MFQSTRPRGARQYQYATLDALVAVSIHAPTRGATSFHHMNGAGYYVSIHAPTRGATPAWRPGITSPSRFQSTRPRGARQQSPLPSDQATVFQSTRPRGARRRWRQPKRAEQRRFNPRAHAGRDWYAALMHFHPELFQSTRPRGARPVHRVGVLAPYAVSIHAPTRGATRASGSNGDGWMVSIHAPTRGATLPAMNLISNVEVSIHAPTRGATRSPSETRSRWRCFNPRAHAGRDRIAWSPRVPSLMFQSTRPRGARLHK